MVVFLGRRENFIALIFVLSFLSCRGQEKKMGPFILVMKELRKCENADDTDVYYWSSSRVNKVGRNNYTYSTSMVFKEPLSDDLDVQIKLAVYGNGGYKPNFTQLEGHGLCSYLHNLVPDIYNQFIGITNKTSCPIPAGEYNVVDLPMSSFNNINTVSSFFYGKYRGDVYIMLGDITKGCMSFFFDIVPKKVKKSS